MTEIDTVFYSFFWKRVAKWIGKLTRIKQRAEIEKELGKFNKKDIAKREKIIRIFRNMVKRSYLS